MSRWEIPMPVTVTDEALKRLLSQAERAAPLLDVLFERITDEAVEADAEYTARDLRRAIAAVRAELDPRN